ncbi:MAG: acyl-CoA desaturase, partial [bacterium]|nr:acyl-CoA desaturase [bacterium]
WKGALLALLIVGALRVVCVWHATWFINSGTHLWGERPNKILSFATNLWLWVFALGEAFHNNHHADERCAWHGWKWYHPDPSKWVIWTLEKLGLAYDVRRPRAPKALA